MSGKTLIHMMNHDSSFNGTSLFSYGWKNLADNHLKQKGYGLLFTHNGVNPQASYYATILRNYSFHLMAPVSGPPEWQEQNQLYQGYLHAVAQQYDNYLYFHGDAFPEPDVIDSIVECLNSNKANVVFPTAKVLYYIGPRYNSPYRFDLQQPASTNMPWGHPYPGGGWGGFKVELMKQGMDKFRQLVGGHPSPFSSNRLTWKDTCRIFNYKGSYSDEPLDMYQCGCFGYDYWTCLVAAGVKSAVATNHDGRSCDILNDVPTNGHKMIQFTSMKDMTDIKDLTHQHTTCRVVAPVLHCYDGLCTGALLCPDIAPHVDRMVARTGGWGILLYSAIAVVLAHGSQDKALIDQAENGHKILVDKALSMQLCKDNVSLVHKMIAYAAQIFYTPFKYYANQEILDGLRHRQ